MSPQFDPHRSRLWMAILVTLSLLATVVILSGGRGRTPAENAALVALHERPATRTVVAAAPATPAAPASSTGDGGSDGSGGDGGSGGGSQSASSQASASTDASDASDSAGSDGSADSGASDDSTDTSGSDTTTASTTPTPPSNLPKVGHVFEIALSTTSFKATFGGSAAPYLRSLESKAAQLRGYESLGSSELADNLAMISGQVPNADTQDGCPKYAEFPSAVVAKANGLVPGSGCVYPETALTIGDQVSSSGHVWRAYLEDQGKQGCVHANSNAVDDVALPGAEPGYDSRHNPFIYFHSLLDLGDCATDDLDLSKLPAALSSKSKTATFSYIAPSACGDGAAITGAGIGADPTTTAGTAPSSTTSTTTSSAAPPTDSATTTGAATGSTPTETGPVSGALGSPTAAACPTGPAGIAAEDAFAKKWVPLILRSPAYKQDGVLIIAVSGDGAKPSGPTVKTGALVLSRYARKGKVIATPYSPYSLLRSVEDLLGYTPLAKAKSAPSFVAAALRKSN